MAPGWHDQPGAIVVRGYWVSTFTSVPSFSSP